MYVNAFTFGAALFWMLSGNAPRHLGATVAANLCGRLFVVPGRNDSEV
jgi:hypothetical protein